MLPRAGGLYLAGLLPGLAGGLGRLVVIRHGHGYRTCYARLHKIKVKRREEAVKGQVTGTLGNSGKSTGAHVHYEVRLYGKAVNPWGYLKE